MQGQKIISLIIFLVLLVVPLTQSYPLSTNKRWLIDDATGERVKLACVNWPSHVGPMLAEGLDKKPLRYIVNQIASRGYNCVRFTWATYMWTREQYAKLTVEESFDALNLTQAKIGLINHNRWMLRMTLHQAFDAVVDVMGAYDLMVVVDNHMSQPVWCCSGKDGNGFFGDRYFDPEEWALGLTIVAKRFKGKSQVIGIGLRNELRGPRQNVADWFKYIKYGVTKIKEVNPDILTIASALNTATYLTFLKNRTVDFDTNHKLVLESHQYSMSDQPTTQWVDHPVNMVCGKRIGAFQNNDGFVLSSERPFPIFFGEIGVNEEYMSPSEARFMECFVSYMAGNDMDWGLWALQGSYYYRDFKPNLGEQYGLLDFNWDGVKNPRFQQKLWILKHKLQDPSSNLSSSYLIYHPQSGDCIHTNMNKSIYTWSCKEKDWSHWLHKGDGSPIKLKGSDLCLKAIGEGEQPFLSTDCSSSRSIWTSVSSSKLHLAAKDENGEYLCLHLEDNDKIVTRKCICIGDDPTCMDDPTRQWFKLVPTNV